MNTDKELLRVLRRETKARLDQQLNSAIQYAAEKLAYNQARKIVKRLKETPAFRKMVKGHVERRMKDLTRRAVRRGISSLRIETY